MYIPISVCNISNPMQRHIVFVFQPPALKKLTFMQNSLICNFSFPNEKKNTLENCFLFLILLFSAILTPLTSCSV